MKKIIVQQSNYLENPLKAMGILMLNRQNSAEFQLKSKLIELEKENSIFPVYEYNHSGRIFRRTPFSDKWDSGLYGVICIPKEMLPKEEIKIHDIVDSILEMYTNWAEGEVYDFCFCNTEDSGKESFNSLSDLYIERIDFDNMIEHEDLLNFMKENKIYHHSIIESLNEDCRFESFRSRYVGKNMFGYIKYEELNGEWNSEIYGYIETENEIKEQLAAL